MAGWHLRCNGRELGQTLGDGEGQGPGMLKSMESQRVEHDQATEQQEDHSFDFRTFPTNTGYIYFNSNEI